MIEMSGTLVETGRAEFERKGSWLWQSVHVHPELPAEMRPPRWTNERAIFAGEPIVSSFAPGDRGERQLQSVMRLEERANRIAAIRSYVFCREVVREIGDGVDCGTDLLPITRGDASITCRRMRRNV